MKDLTKIKVLFHTFPIERKKNKFKLEYAPIIPGINSYSLKVINNSGKKADTIDATISFFLRIKKLNPINYTALAEQMPKFNSKEYASFADYLKKSCQKQNIKLRGKVNIDYMIMTDGTTQFKQIQQNALNSYDDEEKIEKIISSYKGWTPGMNGGKKVNVNVSDIINF